MSRIEETFKALDHPALITFVTAGDPDYAASLGIMKALAESGTDIIELGMAFSDPMADGPVIQTANDRALSAGANLSKTLELVQSFRTENQSTPIVLMGYANPVFTYGLETFAKDAAEAGVDGLIIVDLPPEEDAELRQAAEAQNLDLIRLITPTTDEARLKILTQNASGFLYYVSITGVTGTTSADIESIKPHIAQIKTQTDLPVAIGFGVKTAEDAAKMAEIADAVVVGSAIVQNIADNKDNPDLANLLKKQVSSLSEAV